LRIGSGGFDGFAAYDFQPPFTVDETKETRERFTEWIPSMVGSPWEELL
jgi:hypothetical protein